MSFIRRGSNKALPILLSDTEGEDNAYQLTFRMAKALLQVTEYFRWQARHLQLPPDLSSQDDLNQWVSELENRLILEYNPLANVCAEIINCIGTDDDVKQAFRDFIMSDSSLQTYLTNLIDANGQLPVNPTTTVGGNISLDILWAECVQVVEYTHQAIVDLLEVLETQSNNLELAATALNSIPILRVFLQLGPIDAWLETADYFLETIGDMYMSGYTETIPTGTKWLIACELYCLCKSDKIITVERIWDAIANLLAPYTVASWDNIGELVETVIGVNDNSPAVAYASFALMWGVAKLSGVFGLGSITNSALAVILKIADNDANNDHETLCDCEDEPTGCFNLKPSPAQGATSWYASNNAGTATTTFGLHISGQGLAPNQSTRAFFHTLPKHASAATNITAMTFKFNQAITNFTLRRIGTTAISYTGPATVEITFSEITHPTFFPLDRTEHTICITTTTNLVPSIGFRVEESCEVYL